MFCPLHLDKKDCACLSFGTPLPRVPIIANTTHRVAAASFLQGANSLPQAMARTDYLSQTQ